MEPTRTILEGVYLDSLLFVPLSYLEEACSQLEVMVELSRSRSWAQVIERFGEHRVRQALAQPLEEVWAETEDDEDLPDGFWPGPDQLLDCECWVYSIPMLNDSSRLREVLPHDVMELATYPASSPGTETEPCEWPTMRREAVVELLTKHGFEVTGGKEVFSEYMRLLERA